jgi:hypothetical protein
MSPSASDAATVRRHLLALDEALSHLQTHTGLGAERLKSDVNERWAVERGLQLCVRNSSPITTTGKR